MSSPIVYPPITITWDDGINPLLSSTLPSNLVASLWAYNATITTMDPATGNQVPMYEGLPQLFQGVVNKYLVNLALSVFPTSNITDAQSAAQSANANLTTVIQNSIPTFTPVSSPITE